MSLSRIANEKLVSLKKVRGVSSTSGSSCNKTVRAVSPCTSEKKRACALARHTAWSIHLKTFSSLAFLLVCLRWTHEFRAKSCVTCRVVVRVLLSDARSVCLSTALLHPTGMQYRMTLGVCSSTPSTTPHLRAGLTFPEIACRFGRFFRPCLPGFVEPDTCLERVLVALPSDRCVT